MGKLGIGEASANAAEDHETPVGAVPRDPK
jgi:hypothetical protein